MATTTIPTGIKTIVDARGMFMRTFASSKKNKAGEKGGAVGDDDDDDDDDEELDEDFDVEEEVTMEEFDDDDSGTYIDTAGTSYGDLALKCLQEVLDSAEFKGQYEIFSLKVNESRRRVLVSIDKVDDKFGSPTLDELTSIVRAHNALLELKGFPDDVAVETASPGATRNLRLPRELERFSELTMRVTYKGTVENPDATSDITKVVDIDEIDDSEVVFKLADVEENRPAKKGQGMNKKSREWRLRMPLDAVVRANLFIDI
jgi:ribosome maturation factor RimP